MPAGNPLRNVGLKIVSVFIAFLLWLVVAGGTLIGWYRVTA